MSFGTCLAQAEAILAKYGPIEVGDCAVLVCRDGTLIVELDDDRTLKITVIMGAPTQIDDSLEMDEEVPHVD